MDRSGWYRRTAISIAWGNFWKWLSQIRQFELLTQRFDNLTMSLDAQQLFFGYPSFMILGDSTLRVVLTRVRIAAFQSRSMSTAPLSVFGCSAQRSH